MYRAARNQEYAGLIVRKNLYSRLALGLRARRITVRTREVVAFLFVGALNTVVGYGLFALFWIAWGTERNYFWILVLTYLVGMPLGFFLYRERVFKRNNSGATTAVRYLVVVSAAVGLNALTLVILVNFFNLPVLIAQVFGVLSAATLSYLGLRFWTFKE